ncbi:MAG TPA: ABC transporter permease [Bryobacteraceae bacterium]
MFWHRRKSKEEDLERELRSDLELEAEERRENGLSPEDARYAARRAFGNTTLIREEAREMWGWGSVERIWQDCRYALRGLRKNPGFSLTAVVILGLGIGANATIFSIVDTVLLHPLPVPDSQAIVHLRRKTDLGSSSSFDMHDYVGIQAARKILSALAISDGGIGGYNLTTGGMPEQISGIHVSAQYFSVFQVQPVAGRLFIDGDDVPGQPRLVVISESLWHRRFGGERSVVGQVLNIAGQGYTVVGVAPDLMRAFMPADVYLSLAVPRESSDRTNGFTVIGRLPPGGNLAQTESQVNTIAQRFAHSSRLTNMPHGIVLRPIQEEIAGRVRPALEILFAAVLLVLLVVCSNVANLVLARGVGRRRELAVMGALGARRSRIVGRLLTEGFILAGAGGAIGILLAELGVRALPGLSADRLPQVAQIHVNFSAFGFVLAAAVVCGILASLAPAMQISKTNLTDALKQATAQGGAGRGGNGLRSTLVIAQVALSTLLLVGAMLLVRSFWNLNSVDPGFRDDHLLTMNISMAPGRYSDSIREADYFENVARNIERLPGVVAASSTTLLPFEPVFDFPVTPIGGKPRPSPSRSGDNSEMDGWYRAINSHFFTAMGIPVLRGRTFNDRDRGNSAPVVIINSTLAKQAFPNEDALGKSLVIGTGYLTDPRDLRPRTVVGIVGDTREEGLMFRPPGVIFVPIAQSPDRITQITLDKIPTKWVIRTTRDPLAMIPAVRHAVLEADPLQPPADFQTMEKLVARSIAPARFNMLMLLIFAVLSLMLAAIGIYGLVSYSVAVRTREIGLRISLGAQPLKLVSSLIRHGMALASVGVVIGVIGALALGRFLRTLLFGVPASDPLTLAAVAGTLLVVILLSTSIPASRASAIDPMRALREE